MKRVIGSVLIGVLVGLATGVFVGWELYPIQYRNSPMPALSSRYQEEYTVMVAEGYLVDGDEDLALERLRALEKDNIFDYVEDLTERYISQSKDLETINKMKALCKALGRCVNMPAGLYGEPTPRSATP
jgi:hypothetical protein